MNDNNIQNKNINELLQNVDSKILEREAFEEIKITKKNIYLYIIILVLSIALSYLLLIDIDTKSKFTVIVEKILELEVAFIAIVFGAYALFQAIVSGEFLEIMSKTKNNMLKISNKSFLNLILLYLYAIIMNVFLWLILNVFKGDVRLFKSILCNDMLYLFGLVIYFGYSIIILCELKNFGINLYKMFNYYNAYIILISEEENDHA